jgi:thiamine-phosphate pyrophosphorylase
MRLPAGLLAITPGQARDARGVERLLGELHAAFEAGLRAVSIRERALSDRLLLELVGGAVALADRFEGAWVGVHDSLHVALAAGAHGVHLGFRSLGVRDARRAAPATLALGFSAHATDEPTSKSVQSADYVTFGPVRETPSKAGLLEPCGYEALARVARAAGRPVFALGGLGPRDVAPALAAGACGVAAISSVFGAGSITAATRAFVVSFEAERGEA